MNAAIAPELDPKHQFFPLIRRLDALRRELGFGRHEADCRREYVLRNGVEDHPGLVANAQLAGLLCREIDGHVDVAEIKDRQDTLPCGDHLARAREPVLHTPASG